MIGKIFRGDYLTRLDNIIQWQERDVHQRESVSQHSFKVTIFTNLILESMFNGTETTKEILEFKNLCINHAMFHDWDEALICRDISHNVKYNEFNGEEIRRILNDLSHHLAAETVKTAESGKGNFLYGIFPSSYQKSVHAVVKLADWMALNYFVLRDKRMGNSVLDKEEEYCNKSMLRALNDLETCMEKELYKVNLQQIHKVLENG